MNRESSHDAIFCAAASKLEYTRGIAIVFLSFGVMTRECLHKSEDAQEHSAGIRGGGFGLSVCGQCLELWIGTQQLH